jgi:LIVCS family branched-chain amino acid:cation transporter
MQPTPTKSHTIATGLAMFSMFFGAGNVVFPLAVGQYAENNTIWAILGLLVTAVGVPFLGLIAMTLFNGNYTHFFERVGKIPGFLVALVIMALIGPLGAIPRCITLSHSTLLMYFPDLISLKAFSILSCVIIFLFTFRKNNILDVLGYVLTPVLLLTLVIIIVRGILISPDAPLSPLPESTVFLKGLNDGYLTMDLLGALFFSSIVLNCLESDPVARGDKKNYKKLVFMTLKASMIGASLLAIIYIGFSYVASFNSVLLEGVPTDQLLGALALHILGPYAGIVAIAAVALACLTTAIALAAVFAEFLHLTVTQNKLPYIPALIVTLVITYFVSTLSFAGIAHYLVPALVIIYPALIVLTVVNILHKLHHFKPVVIPFFATLALSCAFYFRDFLGF